MTIPTIRTYCKDSLPWNILDVLGCVATGETPEEVKQLLQEAIVMHLEGEPIPPSTTLVDYIEFVPEINR